MLGIEITGQEFVQELLGKLEASLEPRDMLDEMAAVLLARTRARYLAEEDPDGKKWKPSLASIIRAATGRDGGTLFDTGRLFHSIQLFAPNSYSREIGTDVPYGKYHQNGYGDMHRPFLGISAEDETIMLNLLIKRVRQVLK